MSFYSHPKLVLKRWKIYAEHKDELSNREIEDYNHIMKALKQAPKPLLQFIHSYFYEHATVERNNKISMHVTACYTNHLMKYADYCELVGMELEEFKRLKIQYCRLMYAHYFDDSFKRFLD